MLWLCEVTANAMAASSARRETTLGYIMAVLWLPYGCVRLCDVMAAAAAAASARRELKVSAVPTAPCIFFQPLSSCLAYPGFKD